MLFFYAFFSAIFSATAAVSQKIVLRKLDAVTFSFAVTSLSLIAVLLYASFYGFPQISFDEFLILAFKTLLASLAFLFVMISIKNFELSSVLPVLAFTPALVALTAFVFLDEKLTGAEILGMFLSLTGLYIIEVKEKNIFKPLKILLSGSKSVFIILALLLFTATSVLDKTLIGVYKIKPADFITVQYVLGTVIFAIIFLFYRKKGEIKKFEKSKSVILLLVFIAGLTLLYRFFYIYSLQFGPVAVALTIKRLSVFLAVISSGKLLNEKNILRKSIASLMIITGTYFLLK